MVEDYTLNVTSVSDDRVVANIVAEDFYGARHAIETIFQAVEYDDVSTQYTVLY